MVQEEHHPERCNAGDANLRPHKALQYTLGCILKKAGAQVDIERHEPMLHARERDRNEGWRIKEAIMDVAAAWPGQCVQVLNEVTVWIVSH